MAKSGGMKTLSPKPGGGKFVVSSGSPTKMGSKPVPMSPKSGSANQTAKKTSTPKSNSNFGKSGR